MSVLDNDKKYLIIQMIERATGDYHYPVTLYEAILDKAGDSLESILNKKLKELGVEVIDDVNKIIDDLNIQEIRDIVEGIDMSLPVKEAQLSYLSSNWVKGVLPIEMTNIISSTPKVLVISIEEPDPSEVSYWMDEKDHTKIYQYSVDKWVPVSENDAIILYAITTSYAYDRRRFTITSGREVPESLGISYDRLGDIYIQESDGSVPYVWLGTVWSLLSQKPTVSTDPLPKSSVDPLIDLVSCRYFTVVYSRSDPSADYWYNGTDIISDYTVTEGLTSFLISLFPPNVGDYTTILRRVFICPRKPSMTTEGDVWISLRSYRVYVNTSTTTTPNWVYQANPSSSMSYLSCTNLFGKTEAYDPFTDRMTWLDIRTGTYSTMKPTSTVDGHGVHEITGVNQSLTQRVSLNPNTMYTYSLYLKSSDPNKLPNVYFYADGCEIVSSSIINGSLLQYTEDYVRHYVTFITGPDTTESLCRIESPSGNPMSMHSLCLQEGESFIWTPSIKDLLSDFDEVMNSKVQTAVVTRESATPSRSADCDLHITENGSVVRSSHRGVWVDVEMTRELSTAIESLYSIYSSAGSTRFITSHSNPTSPSIGDYWIKDDLSAVRYTGSGWGNISGVLAEEQRVISTKVSKNTETIVQTVFMETTVDDIFDMASSLDPTIHLYKQGTEPPSPNVGDMWYNTDTGAFTRYNGTSWVPSGSSKVSSIEHDINGIRTEVSEVYDAGGGRNLLRDSAVIEPQTSPSELYTDLQRGSAYVFSVKSSEASDVTQYKVRVTNAMHTFDYLNEDFQVGKTVQIWRFDTSSIPEGATPHLVVTWDSGTLLLYNVQLENGKVYTDWKPAPEDSSQSLDQITNKLDNVSEQVSDQSTKVDTISQELIEAIRISNEALARSVTVEQTAGSLQIVSSSLVDRVTETENELSTYSSVFDFLPEGLQISSRVNGIKSDISTIYRSNGMYFWSASAGADVGYVTAEGLNIRNARIQLGGVLAIGNYKWKPLSSGAIALIYDPN